MRRVLAAAVLGLSLWLGSLAWTGFLLLRTVLDPGQSARVAESLYDDPQVRDQLARNIAGALGAALPPGVPVEQLEAASRAALGSPAVEAVVVEALVASHQAFLGEGDAPEALDSRAFGAAARQTLVTARPELAGVLPEAPSLRVPLPTERIPDVGPVRDALRVAVPLLALAGTVGILLSLGLGPERPAILRRAGFWALGLSAAVLAFGYGLPALVEALAPDQSAVVGALASAMAATTRGPALALAGAGLAALVASLVWRSGVAAPGAAATAPGRAAPAPRPRPSPPAAAARPSRPAAAARPSRQAPPPVAATQVVRAPAGPQVAPPPAVVDPGSTAPTRVTPASQAAPPAPPAAVPGPSQPALGPRWVEGLGWVQDPRNTTIPDEARWVPGVGYVIAPDR